MDVDVDIDADVVAVVLVDVRRLILIVGAFTEHDSDYVSVYDYDQV